MIEVTRAQKRLACVVATGATGAWAHEGLGSVHTRAQAPVPPRAATQAKKHAKTL